MKSDQNPNTAPKTATVRKVELVKLKPHPLQAQISAICPSTSHKPWPTTFNATVSASKSKCSPMARSSRGTNGYGH